MNLLVINRRSITHRPRGNGPVVALLVPSEVQVIKDIAGTSTIRLREESGKKANKTSRSRIVLSRVRGGMRFLYGYLHEDIANLRADLRVWLPEDFAPAEADAFFYIISPTVIIHGLKETSDDGLQQWRVAQLELQAHDDLSPLTNAIIDYALIHPSATLTVAVHENLDTYRALQTALQPFGVAPVPFSTLKPDARLKPLYRHADFTFLLLIVGIFGALLMAGSSAFWLASSRSLTKLNQQIADVQTAIQNIQIQKNLGPISDPQAMLEAMAKNLPVPPSTLADAIASVGNQLGTLQDIRVVNTGSQAGPGLFQATITLDEFHQPLLVQQEATAHQLLGRLPWLRQIRREGQPDDKGGQITFLMQVSAGADGTIPPAIVAHPGAPTTSLVSTSTGISLGTQAQISITGTAATMSRTNP